MLWSRVRMQCDDLALCVRRRDESLSTIFNLEMSLLKYVSQSHLYTAETRALQMGENTLSTAVRYRSTRSIPVGIGDLTVVDDHGVPLRPVPGDPADALTELHPVVRGKDLGKCHQRPHLCAVRGVEGETLRCSCP